MNYIVDKNGKELNEKSNHKKRSWISQNMIAALTMIPIAGAMVNFIVKLYIYIYKMGYSSYFQIPNEYLLINYNITIYNMIIVGSISVVYCMCAVNNVRIILRREMLIKKIFWGILLDFLIPVLICFIILSIATGNWEDALIVLQEERRKCIILVLFIIFSNAIIVFAVGYCMSKYKHIDDFIKIPQLNNNDRLFHYTSAAGIKGITGGEFWITESHFLNDSTEFTIGTDICIEILEKHMRNPRRLLYAKDLLMEQMRKYYREEQEDTVSGSAEGSYVISFCTSGDSLLMWSEYSDFMGYCMEFEYGKLKKTFQEHCGNDCTLFDGKVIYDHDEQTELLEDTIERLLLSDGEDYKTIHGWDDLDSAEEEDVKLFVDHISVICLLYNMFFKKECFAQEQEYRMVFLCVHKREHQVPENSIPVEYRIKDEVFIPFIRMKLGDISCLKSVCVGTKNTSDLAVKGLRHYFGSRNLELRVKKSEIPLRY